MTKNFKIERRSEFNISLSGCLLKSINGFLSKQTWLREGGARHGGNFM